MNTLENIRQKALQHNVPIMSLESIQYVSDVLSKNQAVSILEIGTAVGFSACALVDKQGDRKIDTIERDVQRYEEAVENIHSLGYQDKIQAYCTDAFDFKVKQSYDGLIIDAAKAQNLSFFRLFFAYTDKVCIIDNMNFHGYVDHLDTKKASKRIASMVKKIELFKAYLDARTDLEVVHSDVGDGITVVRRIASIQ